LEGEKFNPHTFFSLHGRLTKSLFFSSQKWK
jgi:hypothetical protein